MDIRTEAYGSTSIVTAKSMFGAAVALKNIDSVSESVLLLEKAANVFEMNGLIDDDMYKQAVGMILDAL